MLRLYELDLSFFFFSRRGYILRLSFVESFDPPYVAFIFSWYSLSISWKKINIHTHTHTHTHVLLTISYFMNIRMKLWTWFFVYFFDLRQGKEATRRRVSKSVNLNLRVAVPPLETSEVLLYRIDLREELWQQIVVQNLKLNRKNLGTFSSWWTGLVANRSKILTCVFLYATRRLLQSSEAW